MFFEKYDVKFELYELFIEELNCFNKAILFPIILQFRIESIANALSRPFVKSNYP